MNLTGEESSKRMIPTLKGWDTIRESSFFRVSVGSEKGKNREGKNKFRIHSISEMNSKFTGKEFFL